MQIHMQTQWMTRGLIALLVLAWASAANLSLAQAQQTWKDPGDDGLFRLYEFESGLGADGYDVVAYFTEEDAVKGKRRFQTEYLGKSWRFSSADNLITFQQDPEHYLPQFGGHCAFGASRGYLVQGSPQAWTVHKGKLYFNYNKGVRLKWSRNTDGYIRTARGHWPTLVEKGKIDG